MGVASSLRISEMARLYLLIDGYNLMHADGLGSRRKGKSQSERNRAEFLKRLLRKLNPELHADTVIVFDGTVDARLLVPSLSSGIAIRFAGPQSDADTEIEKLLATHSSPKQVLIVSSDHRLHKAAARRRATAIDSDVFWELIEDFDAEEWPAEFHQLKSSRADDDEARRADLQEIDLPQDFLDFDGR